MLYGLEIAEINQTTSLQLDRCGRSSLKSLLGLSKFSKNYLLDLLHIPEISTLILQRRVQLLDQLFKNKITAPYLLHLLTRSGNSHFVFRNLLNACDTFGLEPVDIAIHGVNKSLLVTERLVKDHDVQNIEKCKMYLANWQNFEFRQGFKDLLQCEVKRT